MCVRSQGVDRFGVLFDEVGVDAVGGDMDLWVAVSTALLVIPQSRPRMSPGLRMRRYRRRGRPSMSIRSC